MNREMRLAQLLSRSLNPKLMLYREKMTKGQKDRYHGDEVSDYKTEINTFENKIVQAIKRSIAIRINLSVCPSAHRSVVRFFFISQNLGGNGCK